MELAKDMAGQRPVALEVMAQSSEGMSISEASLRQTGDGARVGKAGAGAGGMASHAPWRPHRQHQERESKFNKTQSMAGLKELAVAEAKSYVGEGEGGAGPAHARTAPSQTGSPKRPWTQTETARNAENKKAGSARAGIMSRHSHEVMQLSARIQSQEKRNNETESDLRRLVNHYNAAVVDATTHKVRH